MGGNGLTFNGIKFLSTLPARGATRHLDDRQGREMISIHAPREGSDRRQSGGRRQAGHFYPRSPRGERRYRQWFSRSWKYFYPRSPRGERPSLPGWRLHPAHFYPRSPRGERRPCSRPMMRATSFLSTLPARGATAADTLEKLNTRAFLSTLPARGATRGSRSHCSGQRISIHAPREGSDKRRSRIRARPLLFLSTLPARGATAGAGALASASAISIHAPREGSDTSTPAGSSSRDPFLSTLPARGATL